MNSYDEANNRLSKMFDSFAPSIAYLKNSEDFKVLKDKIGCPDIAKYCHQDLFFVQHDMFYRIGDTAGSSYNNISFPNNFGQVGLFLSMYQTFKRFLESDYDYLIWMEDDVKLLSNFETNLPYLLNQIDFEFDFISLGAPENQMPNYRSELYDIENKFFCLNFKIYSAESFIFSRAGMEKFIHEVDTHSYKYPLDWLLFNVRAGENDSALYKGYSLKPEHSVIGLNFNIGEEGIIGSTDTL